MPPRSTSRPNVFIGSSTPALPIARALKRGLSEVADVSVWDTAFDAGTWLLGGILDRARVSDFGIFVIRPDDTVRIGSTGYSTVRDNVLFEAGIFMGALGPQRTILLWPTSQRSQRLRLPTDLEGLLRETYTPSRSDEDAPNLRQPVARIRERVVSMGRALRTGYNEIFALAQALEERDIQFSNTAVESLREIVQRAARARRRPWYPVTNVSQLTEAMEEHYDEAAVDLVFWWLVIYGVITFDNVDQWTSDGSWSYRDSLQYALFTERGVVLLNELKTQGRRGR